MPRLARVKSEVGGWYHLCCRVGGPKDEYPLNNTACRRRLIDVFEHFSRVFCCDVGAFSIMGNHIHLLVRMDFPQEMSREELWGRA